MISTDLFPKWIGFNGIQDNITPVNGYNSMFNSPRKTHSDLIGGKTDSSIRLKNNLYLKRKNNFWKDINILASNKCKIYIEVN